MEPIPTTSNPKSGKHAQYVFGTYFIRRRNLYSILLPMSPEVGSIINFEFECYMKVAVLESFVECGYRAAFGWATLSPYLSLDPTCQP